MKSDRSAGKVTLADVGRVANVSAITVSRALRKPEMVSPKLLKRIQEVVAELGYVPDPVARALASDRTDVIGVLIPSVTNSVFADVLRGIYAVVEGTSFTVQFGNTRYSVLEEERLLRIFLSQRPAGLIVSGIDQSETATELLTQARCPVVQIMETGPAPVDMMVGFSHRDAAHDATRHLIAGGYRRIAFFGARMDPRTQRRLEGYTQAVKAAGLFDEGLLVTTPRASTVELGCQMLSDLLARTQDVDAIFCNNDDLALGVLFECQRRRIAVPEDIGLCGFNDLEMMAVANPPVTSVRTFRQEMGRRAAEMVLARIAGKDVPEPVVDLRYELMARQSTRGLERLRRVP